MISHIAKALRAAARWQRVTLFLLLVALLPVALCSAQEDSGPPFPIRIIKPGGTDFSTSKATISDDSRPHVRLWLDDITLLRHGNVDLWTLLQSLGGGGVSLPEDGVVFVFDNGGQLVLQANADRFAFDPATDITRMGNGTIPPHFFDFTPLPFTVSTNPELILGNNDTGETTGIDIHGIGLTTNPSGTFIAYPNRVPMLNLFASRGTTDSLAISGTGDAGGVVAFWVNGVEDGIGGYTEGFNFPSALITATVDPLTTASLFALGRPVTLEFQTLFGASMELQNDGSAGSITADDKLDVNGYVDIGFGLDVTRSAKLGSANTLIGPEDQTFSKISGNENVLIMPSSSAASNTFTETSGSSTKRVIIGAEHGPANGIFTAGEAVAIGNAQTMNRRAVSIGAATGTAGTSTDIGDEGISIGVNVRMTGDDPIGIGRFINDFSGDNVLVIGDIMDEPPDGPRDNSAYIGSQSSADAYTQINLNGSPNSRFGPFATGLRTGGTRYASAAANTAAGSFTISVGESSGTATSPLLLHAWRPTTSGQNEQTEVGASLILEGDNAAINDVKSNDVSLRVGAFEDEKIILELTQDETGSNLPQIRTRTEHRTVQTANATPAVLWDSDVPPVGLPAALVYLRAKITVQSWDGGQTGSTIGDVGIIEAAAAFKIDGAANTRKGLVTELFAIVDAGLGSISYDIDVTGATGPIQLEVTGLAGEDLVWGAEVEYTLTPLNPE